MARNRYESSTSLYVRCRLCFDCRMCFHVTPSFDFLKMLACIFCIRSSLLTGCPLIDLAGCITSVLAFHSCVPGERYTYLAVSKQRKKCHGVIALRRCLVCVSGPPPVCRWPRGVSWSITDRDGPTSVRFQQRWYSPPRHQPIGRC